MNEQNQIWIEERYRDYYAMKYRIHKKLYSGQSAYQKVEVVETVGHGKMLLNDDLVMLTERDEFAYHEMIAHVPLFSHPQPENVLIVGGGDGGTAREVLRHPSVKKCIMVEIDEMVVEACQKYIPQVNSSWKDPRFQLKIQDGVEFVSKTQEKFDVVLIDSTDPIGPATPLFGTEFYSHVKGILNPQGMVVSQGENPFYELEAQVSLIKVLRDIFPRLHLYNFSNMTYPGGLWSFTFASLGALPWRKEIPQQVKDSGLQFKYYHSQIHQASFALPEFQRRALNPYLNQDWEF